MCQILLITWYVSMKNNSVNAGNQKCTCLKSVSSCPGPVLGKALLDQESIYCREVSTPAASGRSKSLAAFLVLYYYDLL